MTDLEAELRAQIVLMRMERDEYREDVEWLQDEVKRLEQLLTKALGLGSVMVTPPGAANLTSVSMTATDFRAWMGRSGLSLTQAGDYLGVSRRTVARWLNEGVQSTSAAKLARALDPRPGKDDGFRWSGEDAPAACRLVPGHVGGISAAISYGWSVEPPGYVAIYADDIEEEEVRTLPGALNVRVIPRTLSQSVATSVRIDGHGCTLLASDPVRAVVECTLDPLLFGEPMQEIVRNAIRDGITEEDALGHAVLHGVEVVENVRAALAMAR